MVGWAGVMIVDAAAENACAVRTVKHQLGREVTVSANVVALLFATVLHTIAHTLSHTFSAQYHDVTASAGAHT